MTKAVLEKKEGKTRYIISSTASILVGLTLLASGTGKILGVEETPAQVVDFISNFLPAVFITPATLSFLFDIFVPLVIPWAEVILGVCLLIGFLPRLVAVLCLPLLLAFVGTNLWSIMQGGYATCASCFGIWEQYFGSLTPVQSIIYDLVLFALAIVIIILYPGSFLSSRKWLQRVRQLNMATLKSRMRDFGRPLRNLRPKTRACFNLTAKKAKEHPRIALSAAICLFVLIAGGITVVFVNRTVPQKDVIVEAPTVSGISVAELSETSAVVSWLTDKPTVSSIEVYSEDGTFIITVTDKNQTTTHKLLVGGLGSGTGYHFKILSEDKQAVSEEHSFSTLAVAPLAISDIKVLYLTSTSVTITWMTNRPATSEIEYWDPLSTRRNTLSSDELAINHNMRLPALEVDTIFHYQVKSIDAEGNQVTSPRLAMSPLIGKQAPDFMLNSLDGRNISLRDYRGKLVLLDFWIWTCSACRKKLPMVQEVYQRMPSEKLALFAIHYKGKESVVRTFVSGEKLTIPVLLDADGVIADLYNVYAFPTLFLIDSDGIIQLIDPEFSNATELERVIANLLE